MMNGTGLLGAPLSDHGLGLLGAPLRSRQRGVAPDLTVAELVRQLSDGWATPSGNHSDLSAIAQVAPFLFRRPAPSGSPLPGVIEDEPSDGIVEIGKKLPPERKRGTPQVPCV